MGHFISSQMQRQMHCSKILKNVIYCLLEFICDECIKVQNRKTLPEAQRTQGIESINLNGLFQPKYFQTDLSQKYDSSYRLNTLGPLCLWQCFLTFFFNFFSTSLQIYCQLLVLPLALVSILATRWRHLHCHIA